MNEIAHILVAIDLGRGGDALTPGSRRALGRAVWVAKRVGARLTLLHSRHADEYWNDGRHGFEQADAGGDGRSRVMQAALDSVEAQDVEAKFTIRDEHPHVAIIRTVLREDVDLVVAAKRTEAHTDERKIGTTARKLLRKCPCEVWLEDPRTDRDPTVILAGTDLSAVGDRVVELAASVAHALGAELHVVHAFSMSMETQMEGVEAHRRFEKEARRKAVAHVERVLEPTSMAGRATIHAGNTSPTQAILQGVKQLAPGLVVLGTVSRGGIPGLLMGNTAERLIDRIDCALLTVKPRDFVCPIALDDAPATDK